MGKERAREYGPAVGNWSRSGLGRSGDDGIGGGLSEMVYGGQAAPQVSITRHGCGHGGRGVYKATGTRERLL